MLESRACAPGELPAVIELCTRVFRPDGGHMGREYPLLFNEANLHRLRVVWEDGKPVSHAGYVVRDAWILGANIRVAEVGAVCTDSSARKKGLATAIMRDLEACATAEGCHLMLVSGGRGLYRRMGCHPAGRYRSFKAPAGTIRPARFQVRQATIRDARSLVDLYQAEPVRFERSVDDWVQILKCGMLMNGPCETRLALTDGKPVAYFGIRRGHGAAQVMEYGGSRAAFWHSLAAALEDNEPVEVIEMPADRDLAFLAPPGLECKEIGFPGTVKLLRPEQFFDCVQAILYERVGEHVASNMGLVATPEMVSFEWDGQIADIPTTDIAPILFGASPGEPAVSLPDPPLGDILAQFLPIPLPWYGFSYV